MESYVVLDKGQCLIPPLVSQDLFGRWILSQAARVTTIHITFATDSVAAACVGPLQNGVCCTCSAFHHS